MFAVLLLMAQYLMSQYSIWHIYPIAEKESYLLLMLLRACLGLALWNPLLGHPGDRIEFPFKTLSGSSRAAAWDRLSGGLSFSFSRTGKVQLFRTAHTKHL